MVPVNPYPSIESQVAHLLYFIGTNHSLINGNKWIGTRVLN
jgi:prophage maintenance system killer protein